MGGLKYAALILPSLATLAILWVLDPRLILSPTTPAGGDMAAHVYPVWLMGTDLLPSGRLVGWSHGWFAGFPAFSYYFPLPAVAASLISGLLGLPVAVKLVSALGLLVLPFATHYLARSLGLSRFVAGAAGAAGGAFVFMHSFSDLGGNVASTLVGEYSYSWSLALCILYLGLLVQDAGGGRSSKWAPGIVLAATTLSHILGCLAAVTISVVFLDTPASRRAVVRSWIVGFGLTSFWSIPFIARIGYRGEVSWLPIMDFLAFAPMELWFWFPAGIAGYVILARNPGPGARLFGMMILLGAAAYFVPHQFFNRGRFLPFLFWAIHVMGGIAIAHSFELSRRMRSPTRGMVGMILLLPVFGLFSLRSTSHVRDLAAHVYGGLEAQEEWPEFRAIIERLTVEEARRVFWEDSDTLAELVGSVHAFTLIPYWTGGGSASLWGLWQESSHANPFITRMKGSLSPSPIVPSTRGHPGILDFELGVSQLQVYGVSHFITVTSRGAELANANPTLHFIKEEGPFRLYELAGWSLVDVASVHPQVVSGEGTDSIVREWFERAELFPQWLLLSGPPEWPRTDALPSPEEFVHYADMEQKVWDVTLASEEVSFRTNALGIPHLIKVSYFPNWSVQGAEGPFHAAPSLMVVVPREERVVLRFRSGGVERAGAGITFLTVLLIGVNAGTSLLRGRRGANEEGLKGKSRRSGAGGS